MSVCECMRREKRLSCNFFDKDSGKFSYSMIAWTMLGLTCESYPIIFTAEAVKAFQVGVVRFGLVLLNAVDLIS